MSNNDYPFSVEKFEEDTDLSEFNCLEANIQEFLLEHSIAFQNERLSVTYLVYEKNKIVGFFTISMDSLRIQKIEETDRIGYDNIEYYPAIKIGQMCTDETYIGKGIVGPFMLKVICGMAMEFSDHIGCRFLAVNVLPGRLRWYEKYGFRPLRDQQNRRKLSYYLDITKLEQ